MTVSAVLESSRGLIVAPAGCGKTHLITETLKIRQVKPYLVLTHTTAGVAALKKRLRSLGVPSAHYIVATIDGWAKRVSTMFPASCNIISPQEKPKVYYPELREKVNVYINSGCITEAIKSSYSRLLVDEYQDCSKAQHELICSLAELLPTVIFGDPMQCIFDFAGPMPSWDKDVRNAFPLVCELNTPWRWNNAGTPELGEWVLKTRSLLANGSSIDLSDCPEYVHWKKLENNSRVDSQNQVNTQYQIRKNIDHSESLLIIGNPYNAKTRHGFASVSKGIDVVEPVELDDITTLASKIDNLSGIDLANNVITSISAMMTGIAASSLIKRTPIILAGRNRTPETVIESAVKNVAARSDNVSIANLLDCLEASPDTRIYRNGAFSAFRDAISLSVSDSTKTVRQAAEIIREKRRHQGDRRIPRRAIGSTLLLKGLEADHVLILDAGIMNASNLYVALSRGAKSVTVFSDSYKAG